MTFSIIMLGVLIILVAFNVGESVYNKMTIKKSQLLLLLIATAVLYFIPNLSINGITFTWIGFVLPLIFSVIAIIKVRNTKKYFAMFVCMLIAFTLNIIYNLITFDVYESAIFQPYLLLALILGSIPIALVKTPSRLYASNFIGLLLSEIVFYMSRYAIYGDHYLIIGGKKMFETLMFSFIISLLTYFFIRKVKVMLLRRKLAKREREGLLIDEA